MKYNLKLKLKFFMSLSSCSCLLPILHTLLFSMPFWHFHFPCLFPSSYPFYFTHPSLFHTTPLFRAIQFFVRFPLSWPLFVYPCFLFVLKRTIRCICNHGAKNTDRNFKLRSNTGFPGLDFLQPTADCTLFLN